MLSQTTEPDKKLAQTKSEPLLVVTHIGGNNRNLHINDDLSIIAIKSMQIAEDMAQKRDSHAERHQKELQGIIERHLDNF